MTRDLYKQLQDLIAVCITCRRENTDKWMGLFAERLQIAADAAAIDITISYDGKDAIESNPNTGN